MMSASSCEYPRITPRVPISDWEMNKLRGCTFLSNGRLKKGIGNLRPKTCINIIKVYSENGKPYEDIYTYSLPTEVDEFLVQLATFADLHGIIKLSGPSIWMKQMESIKDLNVDERFIDRISKFLTGRRMGEGEGK